LQPPPDINTWHAASAEDVLDALGAARDGLTSAEGEARIRIHGLNRLPQSRPRSALRRFLGQLNNVLIYLLLGSAAVTAVLGHGTDTLVILLVVLANAAVGYVQEGRAENALAGLRAVIAPNASVMRDGRRATVPAERLVPGDIVLLDPGDKVPADMRLLKARALAVDEAVLTGESLAVEKTVDCVAADAALADRTCMAFSGTMVAAGQGAGIVVATGTATELGRIGELLLDIGEVTTPLLRQVNRFGQRFAVAILVIAAAVFAVAVLARGYAAADAFLAVVGLAVAAIPEGLPAVMTVTLAIGVQRMAQRKAIIRRLPAVETLGAVSVICTDKTGTLTRNEMAVRNVITTAASYAIGGEGYEPRGAVSRGDRDVDPAEHDDLLNLADAAVLCNDAALRPTPQGHRVEGDPMEGALVAFAGRAGRDEVQSRRDWPRTDEIPFDAQHRFMATLHHNHRGAAWIIVKGAPERILVMCDRQMREGRDEPLDHAYWTGQVARLASGGQRVIALARRPGIDGKLTLTFDDVEAGLVLLGLAGIMDPPREEAIAAIAQCRAAGVRVKMITGDHVATAAAIAAQLGMVDAGEVATGHDLDQLDDAALRRRVDQAAVFARTSPEHKLRIVTVLQEAGEIVAMTGDGVNDAPALKRADVGIAMGIKGTEVAKDSAQMVLADDNFASIVAAIREGRTVYDNLRKVIAWTLPTDGGEGACLVFAILAGATLPLSALHILWVNTITAVALGLVLAFEPAEPGVMERRPRRRSEPILSAFLVWRIAFVSALFAAGAFGVFEWAMQRSGSLDVTRTMVVNLFDIFEVFYLFSIRYLDQSSLRLEGFSGTPVVIVGVGAVAAFQALFTYTPFMNRLFATAPLGMLECGVILGGGMVLFSILEIEKLARRRLARVFAG
jgi:magnesium-transporting ATPase (P-type)